jgi:hypothetical protein
MGIPVTTATNPVRDVRIHGVLPLMATVMGALPAEAVRVRVQRVGAGYIPAPVAAAQAANASGR